MRFKIPRKRIHCPSIRYLALILLLTLGAAASFAGPVDEPQRALFWSIHKTGEPAGYLLGTIHSEDPRVLEFSDGFIELLNSNEVFAMELVPDLPTLARLTEYMHLPPDQSLESVIGADRFAALSAALSDYKVPKTFVSRMKPWAALMTLSTPPPVTGFFMDLSLSLRAAGSGLRVVGLESLEQQLSFLENMPMAMQLSLLDQAIAEFDRVNEAHDQMVNAYLENDLAQIQALADEQLLETGQEASRYFTESGINARNLRMARSLLDYLEDDRVFAAVGALHLGGEHGLLTLLRQAGYELKPLDMPFVGTTATADQR